ncbi:MAG TPA: hypothetical protein VMZ28_09845 [Kofleriaceae bacterium]|nr:hypothetical protein [Kofleriaceae bacterium]
MRWTCCLLLVAACGGDKAAEKPTPTPDKGGVDLPQPAEKPGIDAAPGAVATPSGAPPWLVDPTPGKGACREADGALDCSGSARAAVREEGQKQALALALAAMAEKAGSTTLAIIAARGDAPDDVWWEGEGAVVVYVRARLSAEQRAALTK